MPNDRGEVTADLYEVFNVAMTNAPPIKLASPTSLPLSPASTDNIPECTIVAPPTTTDPCRSAQLVARVTNRAALPPDDDPFDFESDDPESEEETFIQLPGALSLCITDPDSMWVLKSYSEAMC